MTLRFSLFIPTVINSGISGYAEVTLPVNWTKLSPSQYSADLNPTVPTVLRLNTAYDPNWAGTSKGVLLEHFRLDTYSNGFLIPSSRNGITVNITYNGQELVTYGQFLSIASISMFATISWNLHRSRRVPRRVQLEVRSDTERRLAVQARRFTSGPYADNVLIPSCRQA